MSDTNISAPPPAGEAVVNQNPVTTPQPIGSQAPQAGVGDHEGSRLHPQSRREATREAIRNAFERAEPGPAKPKMGHNNPPEPTRKEPPKREARKEPPPPLDLKKRPADQERPRAEHGHFAAAATTGESSGRQTQAGNAVGERRRPAPHPYMALPAHTPFRDPPARMADHAKAEWHTAPESVRGEVHRMQKEFGDAYQRMRREVETMRPIQRFHEMARQQGTTLERALDNYTGIERKLRGDPVGGLDVIVHNLNLRGQDGRQLGLRDIAWHVLNLTPDQHRATAMENSQAAISAQLQQLRQQQGMVAQELQKLEYGRRYSHLRGGVDRFAETHPRLDELGDLIVTELRAGYDLASAYRRADLLRPATRAAQTRTQTAQTRSNQAIDRSISGAPDTPSSNGKSRRRPGDKPAGRRDSIASAIKAVNGSL